MGNKSAEIYDVTICDIMAKDSRTKDYNDAVTNCDHVKKKITICDL